MQELGGNATLLFYQSEEGDEVRACICARIQAGPALHRALHCARRCCREGCLHFAALPRCCKLTLWACPPPPPRAGRRTWRGARPTSRASRGCR